MQIEKDGETSYRECAAKTSDTGIAGILTRLASAEVIHYNVLRQPRRKCRSTIPKRPSPADVKNLFEEMLASGRLFGGEKSEIDLYSKARDLETMSRDFYIEKAALMPSVAARDVLMRIAEQEQLHIDFIESILEFVLAGAEPGNWLNADDLPYGMIDEA